MTLIQKQKKVAVIAGGTGYVGSEIVRRLAKERMSVALLHQGTDASAKKAAALISEIGSEGHSAYVCDFSDAAQVSYTFKKITETQGALHLCVFAAGQKPLRKKALTTSIAEMREQLENTYMTGFSFLTESARVCREQKGGIVIGITTAGVVIPEATRSLGGYIPAKYALQGLLTMLRDEVSTVGVQVYSIAPGFMKGGMNADIPAAFAQMVEQKSPTKRLASAHDIAQKIVDLVTAPADTMTIVVAPEYEK